MYLNVLYGCSVECSRSVDEIKSADSVSLALYIIADLLFGLLIIERGVLTSLTVVVDLSALPCTSISFCFTYFEVLYSDYDVFFINWPFVIMG